MKTTDKRIYRIYTPLSWSASADFIGTQAKQLFKVDESGDAAFTPNRRLTPTCILPVIRTYDRDGVFRNGIANDLLADMHWYDGDTELISGTDYVVDTSDSLNRGMLTIYRNTPSGSAQNLRFTAVIADTRRGENVKISLTGISVTCIGVSGDEYEIRLSVPSACYYNPIDNEASISVIAKAFRADKGEASISYELRKSILSGGTASDRALLTSDYEVTSIVNNTFVFDIRMIDEESYIVVGKVNNIEVGRKPFTIKRKYPAWTAQQESSPDMLPGQTEVSAQVFITASNGLIANPDRFFSIQPHTVTQKFGDINWGERSNFRINPYTAGFVDGGYVGIYFDVNEIPALNIALDEDSNLFIDEENGNNLII